MILQNFHSIVYLPVQITDAPIAIVVLPVIFHVSEAVKVSFPISVYGERTFPLDIVLGGSQYGLEFLLRLFIVFQQSLDYRQVAFRPVGIYPVEIRYRLIYSLLVESNSDSISLYKSIAF